MSGMKALSRVAFLLTAILVATPAASQDNPVVGVDVCACQPATYEFLLNFNIGCNDRTVVPGEGITETACVINTEQQQNVTDFVPVRVTTIQILELGQNLQVIAQTPINGDFRSGDTFRYTSVIAQLDPDNEDPDLIPKGLQITLAGRNQEEQDLVNFWLIIFDNNCGVFPVVLEGQQIGWTIFNDLGVPPLGLCPAVGPFTILPTNRPTLPPTISPTQAPVSTPTAAIPTSPPQPEPTEAPVRVTPAPVTPVPKTRSPSTRAPVTRPPVTQTPVYLSGSIEMPPAFQSGSISGAPPSGSVARPPPTVPSGSISAPPPSGSVTQPPPVPSPHSKSSVKCIPRPPLPKKKTHPKSSSASTGAGSKGRGSKLQYNPSVSAKEPSKTGKGMVYSKGSSGSYSTGGKGRSSKGYSSASTTPSSKGGKGSRGNIKKPSQDENESSGASTKSNDEKSGTDRSVTDIPGKRHFGDATGTWQAGSLPSTARSEDDDTEITDEDDGNVNNVSPSPWSRGFGRGLMVNQPPASGSYIRYPNKSVAVGSQSSVPTHDPETGLPYCPAETSSSKNRPSSKRPASSKVGAINKAISSKGGYGKGSGSKATAGNGSSGKGEGAVPSSKVGSSNDKRSATLSGSGRPESSLTDDGPTSGSHWRPAPSDTDDGPVSGSNWYPIPSPMKSASVPAQPTGTGSAGSADPPAAGKAGLKPISASGLRSAGNQWGHFGTTPDRSNTRVEESQGDSHNIFGGHDRF